MNQHRSYWSDIACKMMKSPLGVFGIVIVLMIGVVALYAPFFASSKPLVVCYDNTLYFPLFRYYFSSLFFTKKIDLFCNCIGVWLPLYYLIRRFLLAKWIFTAGMIGFFITISCVHVIDPAIDISLNQEKQKAFEKLTEEGHLFPDFDFELAYMNEYAKLHMVLHQTSLERAHKALIEALGPGYKEPYTLYRLEQEREERELAQLKARQKTPQLAARVRYLEKKRAYISQAQEKISSLIYPLIRMHHWEEDVGGDQAMNHQLPFYELSRLGRQDLMSALIYGARISLFVGIMATLLSLLIGVPLGLISGYYGGRCDMLACRFIEVWESMPAFFMLLMIVAILETKSIFIVIAVIAIFNWTSSFRYVRAEAFRQRELAYVEAARALGFSSARVLFSHLLPSCIVVVVALLPFDIMAAITREAALAFLGLGEEHSCSWGVLMDEGRAAFPQESALLWLPAIALTILLMAIACVGSSLQTALDPKASSS